MSKYILWSGGLDSTLLLYQQAYDLPNETINAVTITSVNENNNTWKMEKRARNKLENKLPKNIKFHYIYVKSTLSGMTWQMPYWLCYLIPKITDGDHIMLAYLSSDGSDFWSKRPELIKAFNSFIELLGVSAKITFPLEYKTKGYVIKELKKINLFKDCWYCGDANKTKKCGKCMKCLSVKRWSSYPDTGVKT